MTLEERVAQLEQQLSEMSVQVLSTDIAPEGYQTSKYSVEESDALLASVASGVWPDAPPWPGGETGGGVPSGVICMFSGSTAPDGWAFCDGTNGTPDLRGYFVIGANKSGPIAAPLEMERSYDLNSKGGEKQHKLKASEMPNHTHVEFIPYSGGLYPLYTGSGQSGTKLRFSPGIAGTEPSGSYAATGSAGGSEAFSIMPPYYSLAYIMKL